MNTREFNNWLDMKNKRYSRADERIEEVLEAIRRLAEGEDINEVLGGQNGKQE